MNNELLELIKTRRSCRKYTAEQVSDEQLAAVMEAGTYAPTAHGCQDPVIVAVQRTDIMQRIIKLNAEVRGSAGNPYYDAPTVLLVFASESNANAFQDGSCVLQNMMLAAHAIGLASCWINRESSISTMRPVWINREYEMFSTDEGRQLMRDLGLPEGLKGIGAISLGHAAAPAAAPKPRKEGWTLVIK